MKHFLFVCFLVVSISGSVQTFPKKYVDSLTAVALSKKSSHPLKLNRESALQKLWLSNSPADRIAIFYDIVGYSDELTPKKSLYYHQLILKEAQKKGDKVLEASVLAELGFITSRNGNTAEGLKMLYKSLELAENTGNAQAIGIAYNNLGNCYPKNLQLSRSYMTKALGYSRKGNDYLFTCFNLGNIADILMQEKKRDSALVYYLESYRLSVEKNLEPNIPVALLDLSHLDKKANSLQYYRKASLMPFSIRNAGMKNRINNYYTEYYIQQKRMDSAFYFAKEVYNNSKTANLTSQLNALAIMGDYYRALPNTDSTLSYLERYYNLKDSLYGDKVVEQSQRMAYNDMQRQKELIVEKADFQNRMILCFLVTVALFLTGLAFVFWRNKRKEQRAKIIVQQQKEELEETLDKLKSTQSQLIQSEKMASLGELTAGIAHEIQNPLNFVNNFSEVSLELMDEMDAEIEKGDLEEAKTIANDIKQNLEKINHHGKRADSIVKGMLQHSRAGNNVKEPTNINALADEYLRLAYHGLRAKDKSFNAELETHFDANLPKINVIPQDIGRVLLNLFTNAFYATHQKQKIAKGEYKPLVSVTTALKNDIVEITVKDNGMGIPDAIKDKIMQPFFTTKPTGEGTGLGLSLSYDIIVKSHGGTISIDSKVNEYTTFTIRLPL